MRSVWMKVWRLPSASTVVAGPRQTPSIIANVRRASVWAASSAVESGC